MVGEQTGLADDLDEWLDARADELAIDREQLLARLVSAHRLAVSDTAGDGLAELPADVADLESRVGAVEDDLDEKIADVRERVVQIKRETDAKAPADHGHPHLADRLDDLAAATETLQSSVAAVEDDLTDGFERYESVVDDLDTEVADLTEKADTLARVALRLRSRVATLEGESAVRAAVTDLQREANRVGVETADCDDCGASVHVGLLGAPVCPHCDATFDGVEPGRRFFGSARLTTGDRPALTGDVHGADGEESSEDGPAAAELFAEDEDD